MKVFNSVFIRLGLTIMCLFAASAFVGSWFSSHFTNRAMFEQSEMHLEAALKSRATVVEDHFRVTQMQVGNLASDTAIINATLAFTDGLNSLESDTAGAVASDVQIQSELTAYYNDEFASRVERQIDLADYLPRSRFCLLYTSPSPRDATLSRMPSSA